MANDQRKRDLLFGVFFSTVVPIFLLGALKGQNTIGGIMPVEAVVVTFILALIASIVWLIVKKKKFIIFGMIFAWLLILGVIVFNSLIAYH